MSLDSTQVGNFLKAHPDFLVHNPGILAFVNLPSPSGGNVASLQDRQVQTMREKVKLLEQKLVELSRAAIENQAIMTNLQAVQRRLLMVQNAADLPALVPKLIAEHFNVPMVQLQLWSGSLSNEYGAPLVDASVEARAAMASLPGLYCGFADHAPWLDLFKSENTPPRSVVLIPLKVGASSEVFGCLGLGSVDKDRFAPTLETDFLSTLAETVCATLSRLLTFK